MRQFDQFVFGQTREVRQHGGAQYNHSDRRHLACAAPPITIRFSAFPPNRQEAATERGDPELESASPSMTMTTHATISLVSSRLLAQRVRACRGISVVNGHAKSI